MTERVQPERDRLKVTFDTIADRYHQARPDYPEELYAALIATTGITPPGQLLEVGCGTGKATLPLARHGYRMTCLEPGSQLARVARANLRDFPLASVVGQSFENWHPASGTRYDLIFAATAWHWVDPAARYQRAHALLRPGGHLAIWTTEHVFPPGGDQFFHELQEIYDEIGSGMPPGTSYFAPGEEPDDTAAIERSGLFTVTLVRHFDWEIRYSAEQYIALLETFSSHIAMAPWQRDRLYGEIRRRLAVRPDGQVRRHWGVVLQIARRRDEPGR